MTFAGAFLSREEARPLLKACKTTSRATVETPDGNVIASPYESSGTAYSQFAIVTKGRDNFQVKHDT